MYKHEGRAVYYYKHEGRAVYAKIINVSHPDADTSTYPTG